MAAAEAARRAIAVRVLSAAVTVAAIADVADRAARATARAKALAEPRLTVLDSGVRVVTEAMPTVRSVTLGFWIGTGSVMETKSEAGLSHLVEHMLFRGTDRYGSLEIDQIFDTMGAELNAGTGKESTSVHARVIDEHLPRAFDVVGDMVWHPRIEEEDLANEREIVLEEIAMYEDDPQDRVFDVLGEAVFGDHPLGRAVIGRADVIAATSATGLRAFHAEHYAPTDVVIAAAGSLDHDAIVELASALDVPSRGPAPGPPSVPGQLPAHLRFLAKETEQYHLTIGAPALARDDERRFVLRVLDNILGGTSSSRLFQEVRESRGLAYNVYSFQSLNAGGGLIGIYLGTRPDNVRPALQVVADELDRLRADGVTEDELVRSKENVKGRIVLSLESTASRMSRLGGAVLSELPLLSVDEVVERIEAVTRDEVNDLLRELLAPERLSAAAVGADEDVFRRAIEPLAPELLIEVTA
ncbi:MAG TPA: pitrilysin family protein [Solirubrobacteraceae bacterium]|nr:pitrilysin family protein [Solirubrobacteraceae bacterium]